MSLKEEGLKALLIIYDFCTSTLVAVVAFYIAARHRHLSPDDALKFVIHKNYLEIFTISSIYVILLYFKGVYSKRLILWAEAKEVVFSIIFTTLLASFLIFFISKNNLPRMVLALYPLLAVTILPLGRFYFRVFLVRSGLFKENLLIVGTGAAGISAAKGVLSHEELGFDVVGFLKENGNGKGKISLNGKDYAVLGQIEDYKKVINDHNIDAVMIATSIQEIDKNKMADIAADIQGLIKRLYIVPEIKGVSVLNSELRHLFEEQLFILKIKNNLKYFKNTVLKRVFDLTLVGLSLPFVLPLFFVIGVLIKIDSEGPVFFVHTRIGKNGKEIKVFKFRSMYKDAQKRLDEILKKDKAALEEWKKNFKLKNDPRITKVGRFLRKTSLDELPQIFNVLKGDMSLVGPRPVVREEIDKYYKEKAKFYYMVKPGITGLWQVSGRSDTDYDFRVNLDTWYVLNWSLWLDIVILFKTIKVVLKKEGAY